jgi:hypothetical protein
LWLTNDDLLSNHDSPLAGSRASVLPTG